MIRVEQTRSHRGHFSIIHHASGYKADIYLAGRDPLHAWAFARRRPIEWDEGTTLMVAPPEYVVLRKLEFFREGGSDKHLADIATMLAATPMDHPALQLWMNRLGLREQWERAKAWR